MHDDADALGVARAGAAFAARRAELGISQRQLANLKIIGAPNLTRSRRAGHGRGNARWPNSSRSSVASGDAGKSARRRRAERKRRYRSRPAGIRTAAVVTGAVTVAVAQVLAAADNLPDAHDGAFSERVRTVLADLRTVESITARAVRSSQGSPEVIKSLRLIRNRYGELMTRAAAATGATLGQRLYTARNASALTAAEAAGAMDVAPDVVLAAEAERPVTDHDRRRIESFIEELAG